MLAGCNVTTKDDALLAKSAGTTDTATDTSGVTIELLGMSANESDVNIVRDQLTKNGFNVKLNIQPDYGSSKHNRMQAIMTSALVQLDHGYR